MAEEGSNSADYKSDSGEEEGFDGQTRKRKSVKDLSVYERKKLLKLKKGKVEPEKDDKNVREFRNKQRVLILASRGITSRYRHLMGDVRRLLPHRYLILTKFLNYCDQFSLILAFIFA